MDLQLKDKVALVFGAGGGLGGAIADELAREGVRLGLASLRPEALEKTRARVAQSTTTVAVPWDLADQDVIAGNIEAVENALGPIDIVVHMTGGPPPSPITGQPASSWQTHFEAMVLSVIGITDAVLPGMRARGWGRVITNVSSGVITPIPDLGLSNALRSTLVGWNKTLAREIASDGVTANLVVPGRIETPRIGRLDAARAERTGITPEEAAKASMASIPTGRYGNPEEYAAAVAFLASSRASYITGTALRVDGGLIPSV
ncbi:SDR family oxidoreductase [Rhodococcus sp. NPDC056960]|uniref:SDR family oxidoreductase n=1 Tax=Rhodococcus sp. NPDC056960 TaxID=3345982 RepID=UPI00362C0C39